MKPIALGKILVVHEVAFRALLAGNV